MMMMETLLVIEKMRISSSYFSFLARTIFSTTRKEARNASHKRSQLQIHRYKLSDLMFDDDQLPTSTGLLLT